LNVIAHVGRQVFAYVRNNLIRHRSQFSPQQLPSEKMCPAVLSVIPLVSIHFNCWVKL